ncbi:MAG: flagellar biosynthetic protein FliR [Phycisphaerae bacterium]|nr:flagellar biosynthetic protein FliR [Phycisphaerae bacterium]
MPWSSLTIPMLLPGYALVLTRLGGLVLAAPMLGSDQIPRRLRALFAAAMALVLFPVLLPTIPASLTLQAALPGLAGELMIGVLMGLGLQLLFNTARLAGMVIGQQGGLSLAQSYDPLSNDQTTALGQVYYLVLFFVFLLAGGHRAMVRSLLDSFQAVPLMSFTLGEGHLGLLLDLLRSSYLTAMRLAGPCLIALLMATLSMGFLSKTMPQLNILSVGFMVRVLLVMGVAAVSLAASGSLMADHTYDTFVIIRNAFSLP